MTLYRDGGFISYTIADGIPSGQVFDFAKDLKGELLIRNDGWQAFTNPSFKNQGDCVSFVNHMNHGHH